MSNCTPTLTLISKPQFHTATLHCLIFLELPIHAFGTYCILYKTPRRMQSIKATLLNFHLWSVLFDVFLSALLTPFMVMPALAGYCFGLFSYFRMAMIHQVYLAFSVVSELSTLSDLQQPMINNSQLLLGKYQLPDRVDTDAVVNFPGYLDSSQPTQFQSITVGASIIGLLECRFNLFMGGATWQRFRLPYHVFNYALAFTYMIPQLTILLPDQSSAIQTFVHLLPCSVGTSREVFGLNLSSEFGYLVVVVVVHNCHLFVIGVYFGFAVQFHFGKLKLVSKQTASLQARLQMAMILQISIPVTVLVGPVSYATFSVLTGYHNQGFNNLTIIFTSFHGILSTTAMIFIHRPYRLAVINLIPRLETCSLSTDYYQHRIGSIVL